VASETLIEEIHHFLIEEGGGYHLTRVDLYNGLIVIVVDVIVIIYTLTCIHNVCSGPEVALFNMGVARIFDWGVLCTMLCQCSMAWGPHHWGPKTD